MLGLLAGVVLGGLLDGETGLGASDVEIALVVHGLLERIALPAENVITVSSSSTGCVLVTVKWLSFCRETYPRFML